MVYKQARTLSSPHRKAMTNLDSILKARDITLSIKLHIVKAMFFSVIMYRYEGWTMKKAEHQRILLFNCGAGEESWESLGLQGDQSILKEINPEYSLDELIPKLKFQYFGHLMQRASSLEKNPGFGERLKAGGERHGRGWDSWMASLAQWTWV